MAKQVAGDDQATKTQVASTEPSFSQYLNISNYMSYAQGLSYGDTPLGQDLGLEPLIVNGQTVKILNEKKGVYAEAFISTGSAPRQIVIGFEGTNAYSYSKSFTGSQVYNDGAIFAGKTALGAKPSVAFARKVAMDAAGLGVDPSNIFLTGHELGGTLAQYASAKTGLGGATFGAAGIKLSGSGTATNFTNYVNAGDPIGNYASGDSPLGPLILSPQIQHYGSENILQTPGVDLQQQLASVVQQYYPAHDYAQLASGILPYAAFLNPLSAYATNLNVNLISLSGPQTGLAAPSPTDAGATWPLVFGSLILTAYPGIPSPSETEVVATSSVSAANGTSANSAAFSSAQVNQYINICNYMYYGKVFPYDLTPLQADIGLKPLVKNGQIVTLTNNSKGVTAEAFVTTGPGPKHVIIAYEGTAPYAPGSSNAFTGSQVYDDTALFAGKTAIGAKVSASFADRVINIAQARGIDKTAITLTGHSLGAAEAQYAAAATGLAGATFGGPGIMTKQSGSRLTNFVNAGDPVGNYASDGQDPLSPFVISTKINHYGGATVVGPAAQQQSLVDISSGFQKDHSVSTAAKALAENVQYHHLTSYAQSLDSSGYDGVEVIDLLPCFCSGTRICTSSGGKAVEDLRIGDHVATVSRAFRTVKWIGWRKVDCLLPSRGPKIWPIRIAAHALGRNHPSRDLYVSPGHAICVDFAGEILIPAGLLVNNSTVTQIPTNEVVYWHIEFDSHDILFAENQPVESYLNMGNRGFFQNAEVVDIVGDPDGACPGHADFCRPFVDSGPLLEAVRARLAARASFFAVSNAA